MTDPILMGGNIFYCYSFSIKEIGKITIIKILNLNLNIQRSIETNWFNFLNKTITDNGLLNQLLWQEIE